MRLLLIYGSGSGLGKSTLAREAARFLSSRNIDWRLIAEEDAPRGFFSRYAACCAKGAADDTAVLLECAGAFLEDCGRFEGVTVADSILPCWDWLASAGCPTERIEAFTEDLVERVEGLRTGLVLVEGDVAAGLERAISDRGREWAVELARLRTGSDDLAELLAYFAKLRAATDTMLPAWPGPRLQLDTDCSRAKSTSQLENWLLGVLDD